MVYQLKCYKLPEAAPQSLGKAMVNILPIEPEETINTVMPMPEDETSWGALNVVFATASGNIRRNNLSDFTNIKRNGKIAMKLQNGDDLVGVMPCSETDDVLLATRDGKAIRFGVDKVRVFRGRDSTGVRGIRLLGNDCVVSMSIINDDTNQFILSVTENGYGKRTPVDDYRRSGRGGPGVANIETSKRNGKVMASFAVVDDDQLMLVTNQGQVIRIRVHGGEGNSIRIASRKTQVYAYLTLPMMTMKKLYLRVLFGKPMTMQHPARVNHLTKRVILCAANCIIYSNEDQKSETPDRATPNKDTST